MAKAKQDKKQKKKDAAEKRRQAELERLQKSIEKQRLEVEQRKAGAKDTPERHPREREEPPILDSDEEGWIEAEGEDELWLKFENADLDGKYYIFLQALESGELDDELAIEMLDDFWEEIDLRNSQQRARFVEMVKTLRQQAPGLYKPNIHYYHEYLLTDAILAGKWDLIPNRLAPFGETIHLDVYHRVIEQLMYYGQSSNLIPYMTQALPGITESGEYFEEAIVEFESILMNLVLLDYMEKTDTPHPDDPELREFIGTETKWNEDWLVNFMKRMTAPEPSSWKPSDFDPGIEDKLWKSNLSDLLMEFMADQQRKGIPVGRSHLAQIQLGEALGRQKEHFEGKKKGRSSSGEGREQVAEVLLPKKQLLDETLGGLFQLIDVHPYVMAATLELIPAYLRFVADLGLVTSEDMRKSLVSLGDLLKGVSPNLDKLGVDPRAGDNIKEAWSMDA